MLATGGPVLKSMAKRSQARVLAFQALHQLDVQGEGFLRELDFFLGASESAPDRVAYVAYARTLIAGAWQRRQAIDDMIAAAAQHWQLHRLATVDRNILRMAVFELRYQHDVPPRVVIDEAVELAKRFSTRQSPGFVNGILDAILKRQDGAGGT